MLHRIVRPLLRVALLSVLLGAVPPAPMPVVRTVGPQYAAARAVAAPAAVTPQAVAHMALASQPAPIAERCPQQQDGPGADWAVDGDICWISTTPLANPERYAWRCLPLFCINESMDAQE